MKVKVYIGVIGSGKDYRATLDCTVKYSFADQLREDVWKMIGWKPETEEAYEAFKKSVFGVLGMTRALYSSGDLPQFTGRDLLQRYGTEVRRSENINHWTEQLIKKLLKINSLPETENLIVGISDARFTNEIKALKELRNTGIGVEFIHVNFKSERYQAGVQHESEKLANDCLQFWGDNKAFQNYIESL